MNGKKTLEKQEVPKTDMIEPNSDYEVVMADINKKRIAKLKASEAAIKSNLRRLYEQLISSEFGLKLREIREYDEGKMKALDTILTHQIVLKACKRIGLHLLWGGFSVLCMVVPPIYLGNNPLGLFIFTIGFISVACCLISFFNSEIDRMTRCIKYLIYRRRLKKICGPDFCVKLLSE